MNTFAVQVTAAMAIEVRASPLPALMPLWWLMAQTPESPRTLRRCNLLLLIHRPLLARNQLNRVLSWLAPTCLFGTCLPSPRLS